MDIKTQVRTIEAYVATLADSPKEQIEILSKGQSMVDVESDKFAVLTIAKRRIIRKL